MIRHVVCFKLTDNSQANCVHARDVLISMRGKVPMALRIEAYIDELHTPRSYDIILEVWLDSYEALDAYQNDPYHCNIVKKHMHSVAAASIALDFSVNGLD